MLNAEKRTFNNREMIILVFALAWPSIVEQALQTVVQYIDSALVGRIGAEASAAVGLTTTVTWLVNSPLWAMGIGVLAYISLSIGAKKYKRAKIAAIQAIFLVLALGIILSIITLSISPFLPKLLGADSKIQRNASLYFAIICIPMIFRASSIIFGAVLRATGDMKTPMIVNLIMNIVNILLNLILIYPTRGISIGGFSFTLYGAGLGVVGSATATAIAYCVSGSLMFISLYRNKLVSPKGMKIKLHKPIMKRCIQVGFPVSLERIASCLGQVVFTGLVTQLGTLALAAHTIAITAEEAFYIPGYGMQSSASTLAGTFLGEKNQRKFKHMSITIIGLTIAIMTITGALLFIFPQVMMSIFSRNSQVIKSGASVLKIVAVSEPMFGALIILEGIFNGIGDTKTPLFIALFSMWGVRILFTFLCVSLLGLGLKAVWCCMVADNVTRFILLTVRFVKGSWKRRFA